LYNSIITAFLYTKVIKSATSLWGTKLETNH